MTQDQNPYRFVTPEADAAAASVVTTSTFRQPESGRRLDANDVRILAFAQRGLLICWCISGVSLLLVASEVLGAPQGRDFALLPNEVAYAAYIVLLVGGSIAAITYVAGLGMAFAVARRTHPLVLAIVFVVLAFAPPFVAPIYPYLHLRANYFLKRHGIPVRWYGAPLRSLPGIDELPLPAPTAP